MGRRLYLFIIIGFMPLFIGCSDKFDDHGGNGGGKRPVYDDSKVIRYTTFDDAPVRIVSDDKFGASIVSHNYIDGEGIIEFASAPTKIGQESFSELYSLTSIKLPDSVVSIENRAFYGCRRLVNISLGKGVVSIGSAAFGECDCLVRLTIPDGCTSIGMYAFYGCSYLTSIDIPEGIASIERYTFGYCIRLKNVVIPDSVVSIGEYAFHDCLCLTEIDIPEGVTDIGKCAFSGCNALVNTIVPSSVASVGYGAFEDCTGECVINCNINKDRSSTNRGWFDKAKFTKITIGKGVSSIGDFAFSDCDRLVHIDIPDSVESIGNGVFSGCSSLTDIEIPRHIASIGHHLFAGCRSLTKFVVVANITFIGNYAFSGCSGLKSITIPNTVKSIGRQAFYGCTGECFIDCDIPDESTMFAYSRFDKIVVGENVVLLGSNAFHNCEYLTDIVIGSKVAKIGNSALNAGLNLENIYCKAQTPPNVESEALSVWEIRTLYVPVGCKQAYMSAQGWNKAKDIIEMEF